MHGLPDIGNAHLVGTQQDAPLFVGEHDVGGASHDFDVHAANHVAIQAVGKVEASHTLPRLWKARC